ncbi:hypothetical protein BD413DRAFT_261007 [Trametes elegans]|nr:hypothetical protein BD413DRAFT_261007 [Trametes elegans]
MRASPRMPPVTVLSCLSHHHIVCISGLPTIHDISILSTRIAPSDVPLAARHHPRISYLFSPLSAHDRREGAMRPCLSRVGNLCAVMTAAPYISIPARGRFYLLAVRYRRSHISRSRRVQNHYPYIHVSHTNALFHAVPLSGLFKSRLFCCCCIVHPTQTHKNTRKTPRKPHTSAFPLQSFPVPSPYFVVSFARASPLPSAILVPARRSHLAFTSLPPALRILPCSTASSTPPVGSLCDIDSLVSPTAHAALFLWLPCTCQ